MKSAIHICSIFFTFCIGFSFCQTQQGAAQGLIDSLTRGMRASQSEISENIYPELGEAEREICSKVRVVYPRDLSRVEIPSIRTTLRGDYELRYSVSFHQTILHVFELFYIINDVRRMRGVSDPSGDYLRYIISEIARANSVARAGSASRPTRINSPGQFFGLQTDELEQLYENRDPSGLSGYDLQRNSLSAAYHFIVCHEIGHIVNGDSSNLNQRPTNRRQRQKESAADTWAVKALAKGGVPASGVLYVNMVFYIYDCSNPRPLSARSHPLSMRRTQTLLNTMVSSTNREREKFESSGIDVDNYLRLIEQLRQPLNGLAEDYESQLGHLNGQ